MKWNVKRDGRALQRIVALLFALAALAERAAAMPSHTRAVVLAILCHAEGAAWAFALGAPCVSTVSGRDRRELRSAILPGAPVGGHDGSADAIRLAVSLRLLALIVAGWATKTLSSTAAPSPVRDAMFPRRPCSSGNWRGPAASPAPDTS